MHGIVYWDRFIWKNIFGDRFQYQQIDFQPIRSLSAISIGPSQKYLQIIVQCLSTTDQNSSSLRESITQRTHRKENCLQKQNNDMKYSQPGKTDDVHRMELESINRRHGFHPMATTYVDAASN